MIWSDVGERGGGEEAHSEHAREVTVLAVALVAQVKRVLLLTLVGLAEQDHLTQEGVHDHVLVVELSAARGRIDSKGGKREREEKRQKEVRVREKQEEKLDRNLTVAEG